MQVYVYVRCVGPWVQEPVYVHTYVYACIPLCVHNIVLLLYVYLKELKQLVNTTHHIDNDPKF